MANITKRESKSGTKWRVLVRLKGSPPQSATFARKTDALRWAQATESAIREGRYFATPEARRRTLRELLSRYIETVIGPSPPRGREKRIVQLRWWAKRLGDYVLADVTPSRIAEGRDALAAGEGPSGRPASPATTNRYLAALSHGFTVAVREWGWLAENPVRKVRRLTEPRGRVRFLSDEERERLLTACRQSSDGRLYPLVVAALGTGARQGELLQLRWPDVDLARSVAIAHTTKNGSRRALPLSAAVRAVLADLGKVRTLSSDLVFANRYGKAAFPRSAFLAALMTAEIEDFRFHDLRHSAASYLAMNGATLAEIAEVLGHKTLAMVRRYSHMTEGHVAGVVERMNARILGDG